jgi:mercuric ion binding protein
MTKRLLMTTVLLGSIAMATAAAAAERTVTLALENMTCAACSFIVKRTMAGVPGVLKVDVSYANKTATVTFDDTKTQLDAVAKASADAGYPAWPTGQGG